MWEILSIVLCKLYKLIGQNIYIYIYIYNFIEMVNHHMLHQFSFYKRVVFNLLSWKIFVGTTLVAYETITKHTISIVVKIIINFLKDNSYEKKLFVKLIHKTFINTITF